MGLIERIQADRAEKRVIGSVPWRPWESPFWKFNIGGPVHPSRAFFGQDQALGLPALYSCTRLIAESIASLPLKLYISPPGSDTTTRYTGPSIFDQPSTDGTLYDWLFQCLTSLLLHGNAWGLITGRDGYGYPTGIEWIPPDRVAVEDDAQQPWNPLRARVYVEGRLMSSWREDLFHVKGYALAGRIEGVSPLRAFALTVLSGIESQKYGVDWFTAGGFPSGVFRNEELEITADDAREIRESLMESIHGHKPLVIGRDWDYKPVAVPPSEAQFLEATQMNATQLAAVFGLPPERVGGRRGDSLTYNTVEQSTLQVIEALRPWLVRLENAFFSLLPQNRYCRFNVDALLKTDLKTRTEIYAQQRAIGLRSTDELRDQEDLPPLPGNAGNENIPLDVMVAMSRSIRAVPNSMLSQITLEVDLITERLRQLQGEGLTKPEVGPTVPTPEDFLSGQVGSVRSFQDLSADDLISALIRAQSKAVKVVRDMKEPEFIGPWIPSEPDLARLVATGAGAANGNGNGNGNGRAH